MLNDLLAKNQSSDKLYVEDVFSTYLYTGTGATNTITNGINLSGKGGLVWYKRRDDATNHFLADTTGTVGDTLSSNNTAQKVGTGHITSFNSNGYTLNSYTGGNGSGFSFDSWTFRKAPKFFDVVTWTGNGANRTISHSLGVAPGMIIVKRTDTTGDWQVYHRSLANTEYAVLNSTAAKATGATRWNSTTATDTVFSLGTDATVNANSGTYVAYLFAHDTTTDGVVQCGSFTTDGSGNATVSLGWEPQYLLVKCSSSTGGWYVVDNMRGFAFSGERYLEANTATAEAAATSGPFVPTATGFTGGAYLTTPSATHIYLAIRRGPMRTPTDATKVFAPVSSSASTGTKLTTDFPIDLQIGNYRPYASNPAYFVDRLRGASSTDTDGGSGLTSTSTAAEVKSPALTRGWDNTGFKQSGYYGTAVDIFWNFRRAPGFFDVVCYTGTGSARTVSHNLGVAPELMIVKRRDTTGDWQVYAGAAGEYLVLNSTAAKVTSNTDRWNNTAPTSTVFSLGTNAAVNASGGTYVAYLFATCAGVSKIGSYTGTGTTLQINCGFTNGARFVLIKRTDSTGDWYVYDSARGIVAGNDPYLLLNSTAAEVTNTDYVDAYSAGFELSSTAPAALNANGGTYIYLAIA